MPDFGNSNNELTVFSAARQLPRAQWVAFLDEACAGDSDLRRRVEELLQATEQAAAFMETPAGGSLDLRGVSRPAAAPAEKPGDWIGQYQLIEQLGEGGCGVVYLARQERPVRREVALKIIKLGMDTRSVVARFEGERQALAMMDHPNIARVLDAGATDTGRPYFVMELVRGVKITDCCDQNNLSTRERLELFMQVCHAIQHAHQKGIIHRDIKPSNILVTQQDGEGVLVPKVIDFGIAKATHGRLTDQTYFTAFEQFIGTPAYMSPEQAEVSMLDVDTRTDIYSLGVLLYELLTGQTPFDARELLQSGLDEIRRTIREREPATPSTRLSTLHGAALSEIARHRKTDVPQLVHLVRGDLDWIVMKALEKDRARRYDTANGLAADIRRHLNNEPVAARPPSQMYRFQKLVRRNRLAFAAAGVIAIALAVGAVVLAVATAVSIRASIKAKAEALKVQKEAIKSQQVAQFLGDMLKGVGPSVAMGNDTTLLKKILDNTANRIGTDLAKEPEVESELRYTLGEVYWEVGDLEKAEAMHRRALEIRRKIFGPKDPRVADSMRRLGHVLWRRGSLDEAEVTARAGIELQRELFGSINLEVARSLQDFAAILNTKGRSVEAEAVLREALTTKEAVLGDDNLEVADSLDDLAWWLFSRRYKRDEADALARKAIAIREKLLGADNLLVKVASLRLEANEFDIQGRSSEQEAALYKLVAAKRELYGSQHPSLAQTLNTLASVLRNEGKLAESEPIRREALTMQRKLLGEENAEVGQTFFNLGELLFAENKLPEAEEMYRNSLVIRAKVLGPNSVSASDSLVDLGRVLEAEGRFDDARKLYLEKARGKSVSSAAAQHSLGMMYLRGKGVLKDEAEGAKWIRKSAELGDTRAEVDLGVLYFNGTGLHKDEEAALSWFHRADNKHTLLVLHSDDEGSKAFHKSVDQGNVLSMKTLANCYCAAGRSQEAIATLMQLSQSQPKDADVWLTRATWQLWFGRTDGYNITCQLIAQNSEGTKEALTAESAAKAFCLAPCTNAGLLARALELARLGVDLRKGTPWLPWYQLSLGMAEYRNGQYADAEQTLATAEQTAGKFQDIPATARMFRAMSVFRLGRADEARQIFSQGEVQMPLVPQDPGKPLIEGKIASHDVIIGWLAYKEAKSVLGERSAAFMPLQLPPTERIR